MRSHFHPYVKRKASRCTHSIRLCFVHGSQVTRECFTSYQSEFCLHADNNVLCNQCADKLKTRNSSLHLFCCFDLCFCWHDFQHSYHFTHSHREDSLRYRVNRKFNESLYAVNCLKLSFGLKWWIAPKCCVKNFILFLILLFQQSNFNCDEFQIKIEHSLREKK